MGVDCHITFTLPEDMSLTDETLDDVNKGLNAAFGDYVTISRPRPYFDYYSVSSMWRYYDTYANRGFWPEIRACLDFLRRNLPDARILYGPDTIDSDEANPVTVERIEAIDAHFAAMRER